MSVTEGQMRLMRRAAGNAARTAAIQAPRSSLSPALVQYVDAAAGVAGVLIDGDTNPTEVQLVGAVPAVGDRAMIQFQPPHGVFLIGAVGGTAAGSGGGGGGGGLPPGTTVVSHTNSTTGFVAAVPPAPGVQVAAFSSGYVPDGVEVVLNVYHGSFSAVWGSGFSSVSVTPQVSFDGGGSWLPGQPSSLSGQGTVEDAFHSGGWTVTSFGQPLAATPVLVRLMAAVGLGGGALSMDLRDFSHSLWTLSVAP